MFLFLSGKAVTVRHILVAHQAGLPPGAWQRGDKSVGQSMSAPGNDGEARFLAVMKNYSARRDLLAPSSHSRFD